MPTSISITFATLHQEADVKELIGRFVAVLRAWAAFLAGTNRMRWPRFLLFNAAGGLVWATLYGLGGYFLGDTIHRLVGPLGIVFLVLAVLLIIAGILIVRHNEPRLEDEAVRALPGPLDLSFARGKRPGEGHSRFAFHVARQHPASHGKQQGGNGEETCRLLAADFPHHSGYTRRCWMRLAAGPR